MKWDYLQLSLAVDSFDLTDFVCYEGVLPFRRLLSCPVLPRLIGKLSAP